MDQQRRLALFHMMVRLNNENLRVYREIIRYFENIRNRRARRQMQAKPYLMRRSLLGEYETLFKELEVEDPLSFKHYLRIDLALFREIEQRIQPRLRKGCRDPNRRITPAHKLAITLRHLASGEYYRSSKYHLRVSHNTQSVIVREV